MLSQLVQRHTAPSLPLARQPSPPSQQQAPAASASPAAQHTSIPAPPGPGMTAAGAKPVTPNAAGLDSQGSNTSPQPRAQLKGQKRRIPPTSKVGNQSTLQSDFSVEQSICIVVICLIPSQYQGASAYALILSVPLFFFSLFSVRSRLQRWKCQARQMSLV